MNDRLSHATDLIRCFMLPWIFSAERRRLVEAIFIAVFMVEKRTTLRTFVFTSTTRLLRLNFLPANSN